MSFRPLQLAYLGFAILGAAVLGAFFYDSAFKPPRPAERSAPLAATAASDPAPTIPTRRPDFALRDLDGRLHTLADWNGKALVVNFWATWCAPCRREIPLLNDIAREQAPNGVEVVGIAVDFADDVRAFLRDVPIHYPLLIGEEDGLEAARAFGVANMALPFTAFIDNQGRILTLHLGELQPAQADAILRVLRRLGAGTLSPEAARAEVKTALEALPPPPENGSRSAQG